MNEGNLLSGFPSFCFYTKYKTAMFGSKVFYLLDQLYSSLFLTFVPHSKNRK